MADAPKVQKSPYQLQLEARAEELKTIIANTPAGKLLERKKAGLVAIQNELAELSKS